MLGGLGSCGRPICCGAFLGDFQPVSIKMAKEQNLSLNPTKISGLCGRLMCCLKYDQDTYEATLKRIPKVGKDIVTPDGVGVIAEINAIKERVKVRIRTADDTFDVREYSIDEVRRPGPGDSAAIRETPKPQEKRPRRATPETEQPAEEDAENVKKKHYPHQKAPKNLSTDEFLEKMRESESTETAPSEKAAPAEKEPHKRRRRGGKGRHRDGEAPAEAAESENVQTEVQESAEAALNETVARDEPQRAEEQVRKAASVTEDEEIVVQDEPERADGREAVREPEMPADTEK